MSVRSASLSHEEDFILCRVYMDKSQDSITGVYQSQDQFWDRVSQCYNNDKPQECEPRIWRSCQSRIQTIEKATRKLHACIRKIKERHPSSASNEDIMRQAKVLFKEDVNYKTCWKYEHVWDLIKDFQKFQDGVKRPSLKISSSNSENLASDTQASIGISTFDLNLDSDESVLGGSPLERPAGVKKAKLKRKKEVEVSSFINNMQEENKQFVEEMKNANAHMKQYVEIQRQHKDIKDKNYALKQMMVENNILLQDMSAINDPHIRAHIEAQQRQILQKRALQQQDPEDPLTMGNINQYFDNIEGSNSDLPNY